MLVDVVKLVKCWQTNCEKLVNFVIFYQLDERLVKLVKSRSKVGRKTRFINFTNLRAPEVFAAKNKQLTNGLICFCRHSPAKTVAGALFLAANTSGVLKLVKLVNLAGG